MSLSFPLSSEGSLVCHTYFDTGHPFVAAAIRIPNLRILGKRSNQLRHRGGPFSV